MANTTSAAGELEFMIKLYPGGPLLRPARGRDGLKPGDALERHRPLRRLHAARRARRGGSCSSAAARAWRRSSACCARWPRRAPSARRPTTTARAAPTDLFHLEELEQLGRELPDFTFVPALSEAGDDDGWTGETGLITDVVDRLEDDLTEVDAYLCGPPPMVDAAIAMLDAKGVPEAHIYFDKFTTTEHQ